MTDESTVKVKEVLYENFCNYKKPAMFIGMGSCTWKCCVEGGFDKSVCQNLPLATAPSKEIDLHKLFQRYVTNSLTQSLVIGGLEPFDDFTTLIHIATMFRKYSLDDIVIYTGYYPHEITQYLLELTKYSNIILKCGRYIPNRPSVRDGVLGVDLVSDNQYGVILNQEQQNIIQALNQNDGYCPCMIQNNDNTKCCCLAFRNQSDGNCHCGLFRKN